MDVFKRTVRNIDHPEAHQGMTPQHRVRPLLPAAMCGDRPIPRLDGGFVPARRVQQASSSGHRNRQFGSGPGTKPVTPITNCR
jgi:hypothetical protein